MLTPDYLYRVAEPAEAYAAELRKYIIRNISERIIIRLGRGEEYLFTAIDRWQIETLQEAGILLDDIQNEIAKYTRIQQAVIMSAMEEACIETLKYDDEVYRAAGLSPTPFRQSPGIRRILERDYNVTMGDVRNFTRTTALEAQRLYISECDNAYRIAMSGTAAYSHVVREAIENAISGGGTVSYPSGHVDTLETAVARSVRTGISQSASGIQLARMEEMDWEIIGTTAHLGARTGDGGMNHTNHLYWQGQFYSRTGRDRHYPDFRSSTGYGKVDGLCGANCRHGIFPGDGNHNPYASIHTADNYHMEQINKRQRELERRIRKTKYDIAGLEAAVEGCKDNAARFELQQQYGRKKALLKSRNKAYDDFCWNNEVKKMNERLRISKR